MKDVNILVEALPYIKKFHEKKILIKYGGHAMIDEDAMSSTVRDTVLLKYVGMEPLIVHGGGPEISRSMDKLGKEPKFIKGLRVTDEESMVQKSPSGVLLKLNFEQCVTVVYDEKNPVEAVVINPFTENMIIGIDLLKMVFKEKKKEEKQD